MFERGVVVGREGECDRVLTHAEPHRSPERERVAQHCAGLPEARGAGYRADGPLQSRWEEVGRAYGATVLRRYCGLPPQHSTVPSLLTPQVAVPPALTEVKLPGGGSERPSAL